MGFWEFHTVSSEILKSVTDETLKSGDKCDASGGREIFDAEEGWTGR